MSEIDACRLCGSSQLEEVLDLGEQCLTGVFPPSSDHEVTAGRLRLVKCHSDGGCNLVQLDRSFDPGEMYGDNYGYRSGLNQSMVRHLQDVVHLAEELVAPTDADVILDIGSNDGTTLSLYRGEALFKYGMDPTAAKFEGYYDSRSTPIADFFSADRFLAASEARKAKVVTSLSMFYDLEDPLAFARDVARVLDDQGIWILEQSYLPSMLETVSYDTICHEHVEYYALEQIEWIVDQCEMEVVRVDLNDVNGGSFLLVVQKRGGPLSVDKSVDQVREAERSLRLDTLEPFRQFEKQVAHNIRALKQFLEAARQNAERVVAFGASTKGNVVLQAAGINREAIDCVGDVNPDKYGCVTPGSKIPIVAEDELLSSDFDYALVLPWHFRQFFDSSDRFSSVNLVYAHPVLDIRRALT